MNKNYTQFLCALSWLVIGIIALVYCKNFTATERGLVALGFVGIWRYSLQLIHIVRNILYTHKVFPAIRAKAESAQGQDGRFNQVILLIADFQIHPSIRTVVWEQILHSARQLPSTSSVHIVYTSDYLAERFQIPHHGSQSSNILIHHLVQCQGKRIALADALEYIKSELVPDPQHALIALMDGDTGLHQDTLTKLVTVFNTHPKLGAVTTNEEVQLACDNMWITNWYKLKFQKRNHYMKSHALSKRVLTLTGRFSVYTAEVSLSNAFIERLKSDAIYHWLHGSVDFVMGDDKSTCYALMQSGKDMLYLPDTYVTTYECISGSFLGASVSRMIRWYGNMLRNAPRNIKLGFRSMPGFIWYCYLDQMISYWTTLIGPILGFVLLFKFGPLPFLGYVGFVLVSRTLQLMVLVPQGHQLTPYDLLLVIYDQWIGSLLKIYSTFYPHIQSFALRQKHTDMRTRGWKDELSYSLITMSLICETSLIILILQL